MEGARLGFIDFKGDQECLGTSHLVSLIIQPGGPHGYFFILYLKQEIPILKYRNSGLI